MNEVLKQQILDAVPKQCPSCNSETVLSEDYAHLQCQNEDCPAKFARRIEIYAKTLGLKWFGPSACAKIAEAKTMAFVSDLLDSRVEELFLDAGISEGIASNMMEEILKLKSKSVADWKCIAACTPDRVGPSTAKALVEAFGSVDKILSASAEQIESRMERTGPELAERIRAGLVSVDAAIFTTRAFLQTPEKIEPIGRALYGLAICVTGAVPVFVRRIFE